MENNFIISEKYNSKIIFLAFRRIFAKFFDYLVWFLIATIIVVLIPDFYFQIIENQEKFYLQYSYIITSSFFIFEFLSFLIFWNTLWKKLFWIKILSNSGEKLNFKESLKIFLRNSCFLISIFIFPIFIIFSIIQFIIFCKNKSTTYDKNYTILYKEKLGFLRIFWNIFTFILIIFITIFILAIKNLETAKIIEEKNVIKSIEKSFEWKYYEDEYSITKKPFLEKIDWKYTIINDKIYKNSKKNLNSELFKKDTLDYFDNLIKNWYPLIKEWFSNYVKYNIFIKNNFYDNSWNLLYTYTITPEEIEELLK